MKAENTTRKALGNIQTSMLSQPRLVGTNGIISVEKNRKRKFNLDSENAVNLLRWNDDKGDGKSSATSNQTTQTVSQEAYDLMVKDEPPAKYWKDLAEQRRQALSKALEENELLVAENKHLQKLVDQLLPLAEFSQSLLDREDADG